MSVTLIQGNEDSPEQTLQQASINDQLSAVTLSGQNPVQYVPTGTGRTYKSPIDQVTFLLTGEQTGGAFFMAEAIVPPGCGNPPHFHEREEETFYLQQGSLVM